mmetsp:Transcript_64379/g.112176  ORF Transcript_64379/g.112176 Transcript_64379/m.112176 type:complete len:578 (-) Transcript_64379:46-1779(-)
MTSYGSTELQAEGTLPEMQMEGGASSTRKLSTEDERDLLLEDLGPYIAEFVGTLMFTFTYGCCQLTGAPMFNPTAMASILTVCIYSFGPVSGGYFNPAITITAALCGKLTWRKASAYCSIQVIAGIFASGICAWVFTTSFVIGPTKMSWQEVHNEIAYNNVNGTEYVTEMTREETKELIQGTSVTYNLLDMATIEFIFTAMLCFVHANCVMSKRNNNEEDPNHFYGAAVGFFMIAAGQAGQHISGAFCNPAVTVGMNLTSLNATGYVGVGFVCAQVLAAVAAAALFAQVRPEDFDDFINFTGSFLPPLQVRVIVEFTGTFVLVLVVGLCIIGRSGATAWAGMAALMSLSYALNDVSGAQFNPAVSFALVLSRRSKMSIDEFIPYAVAQVGAGAVAGLVIGHYKYVGGFTKNTFMVHVQEGFTWTEAATAEMSMTCLLAFTYLACATVTMPPSVTRTNFYFGISFGACLAAGGFAIGAVTGGVLNPALSAALTSAYYYAPGNGNVISPPPGHAFITDRENPKIHSARLLWPLFNACLYSCMQLGGGLLAAAIFFVSHQREYMKQIGFPVSTVSSQGLS